MKTRIISLLALVCLAGTLSAQTVNWRSWNNTDRHVAGVYAGWDYATTAGVNYGYRLKSTLPLLVGGEVSLPAGSNLLDDFKIKGGIQAEVITFNHFSATVKVNGIFRRYESEFVRLGNFGSEFSAVVGYYKKRWYSALEIGFDKAIVTHMKHSDLMQDYYPQIKNGWFIPNGGNFSYGLQLGYSIRKVDLTLRTGKTITQDFKTKPAIPFHFQLGVNKRF